MSNKKERVVYTANGIVVGNLWGGGKGYYPARKYRAKTLSELKKEINSDFKSGGLDSGMGYESLTGALMYVTKHTTIKHGKKDFTNTTTNRMWIGKINKREADKIVMEYSY